VRPYEERREARVEALRQRASKKRAEAQGKISRARSIAEHIPLGQPILTGHSSERRHRGDIAKIRSGFEGGYEALKEAEELERRARAAERNTAISSDDPEAIEKLRAKLAQEEASRDEMKRLNAIHRKGGWEAVATEVGVEKAADLRRTARYTADDKPFPPFALTNAGATIRRLKERIEQFEKARAAEPAPAERIGNAVLEEEDNRTRIRFDGKPDAAMRQALKSSGFRWAPSLGVWQRHASEQARHAARRILGGGT
jgi:hypothetical protein